MKSAGCRCIEIGEDTRAISTLASEEHCKKWSQPMHWDVQEHGPDECHCPHPVGIGVPLSEMLLVNDGLTAGSAFKSPTRITG